MSLMQHICCQWKPRWQHDTSRDTWQHVKCVVQSLQTVYGNALHNFLWSWWFYCRNSRLIHISIFIVSDCGVVKHFIFIKNSTKIHLLVKQFDAEEYKPRYNEEEIQQYFNGLIQRQFTFKKIEVKIKMHPADRTNARILLKSAWFL